MADLLARRMASTAATYHKVLKILYGCPHTVTSRAFDVDGHQQPAPDDPFLASKRTYWESNGKITRRVTIP